jgi:hypothetical protein
MNVNEYMFMYLLKLIFMFMYTSMLKLLLMYGATEKFGIPHKEYSVIPENSPFWNSVVFCGI